MTATAWKSRPAGSPSGIQEVPTPEPSLPDRAHGLPRISHADPNHRRPAAVDGEHFPAAQWARFEKVATELVEAWWITRYDRSAAIHEQWAQRYAELNDSEQARECHSTATALRQRAELIRRYPGEFSDTLAVLADIFTEGVTPLDGAS